MDDRLSRIEDRLREAERLLAAVCAQVRVLEPPQLEEGGKPPALTPALPRAAEAEGVLPLLTLAGRTLVILGGAFLLRAVTDSGRLPASGGIMLGFAYASTWIGAADRAAIRRPASGLFHGIAAIAIGFPLLFEASVRFGALSPEKAAPLLVALTMAVFAVSWHRHLPGLAGVAAVAGSVTSITLAATTGRAQPFALAAIAIGCGASVMSAHRDWRLPAWPPALAATLLVLAAVIRAQAPTLVEPRAAVLATALLLAVVYMGIAIVTAVTTRPGPNAGDIARGVSALAMGLGGGFVLARSMDPRVTPALGFAVLACGLLGYGIVSAAPLRWSRRATVFLSSVSTAALIVGASFCLGGTLRDLSFAVMAIAMMRLGESPGRQWSFMYGVIAAVVCAITSGLAGFSLDAWTGAAAPSFMTATAVLALGVLAYASWLRFRPAAKWADSPGVVAAFIPLSIALVGIGAVVVYLLDVLDARPATAGVIAAERSVIIAFLATAIAGVSRMRGDAWFKWLAYAALIAGCIKLAIEDMSVSSPLAIFIAFGAYGVALIASARILSGIPAGNRET